MNTEPSWRPNWRDDKAYPQTGSTTDEQWVWEFLRRNPEYINTFRELPLRFAEEDREGEQDEMYIIDGSRESLYVSSAFGIHELVDPAKDFDDAVEQVVRFAANCRIVWGDDNPFRRHMISPFILSAAVYFRLDGNLDKQWNGTKKRLQQKRSELEAAGKLPNNETLKSHRRLFSKYLRILDAIELGEKKSEIAKVILNVPKADSEHVTTISKYQKAAQRFRDTGYRVLMENLS